MGDGVGETAPNAVLEEAIERLYRGYRAIYNTIMMYQKETRFFKKLKI